MNTFGLQAQQFEEMLGVFTHAVQEKMTQQANGMLAMAMSQQTMMMASAFDKMLP